MNTKADDIYQELLALPESKLAEVQQFVEFMKYQANQANSRISRKPQYQLVTTTDLFNAQELDAQMPVRKLENFAMPALFENESIDDMLDYIYQQRQKDKKEDYE